METYAKYKEQLLQRLIAVVGKNWDCGIWAPTGKQIKHILPLKGKNTKANRAESIAKYLNFDCTRCLHNLNGLHQYAHHLNSSQLLCMMFFSQLIEEDGEDHKATDEMVNFINKAFGIKIKVGAICSFEYTENYYPYIFEVGDGKEYEGTSFDFHIKDDDVEIYFEIKLTESGFGKVLKPDRRHQKKAEQYVKFLPAIYKDITAEMMLKDYQIFRNIIRARNKNANVIFITDGQNPATNKDIAGFIKQYGPLPVNVKFFTWQEIASEYPCELPFQLKAMVHDN